MPASHFNPQNRTAPCDEPSPITDDQAEATRHTIADWCSQQVESEAMTHDEAKAALVDIMQMLGVYPGQIKGPSANIMAPIALNADPSAYTIRR
jgi:hypothetical protein